MFALKLFEKWEMPFKLMKNWKSYYLILIKDILDFFDISFIFGDQSGYLFHVFIAESNHQ